MNIAPGKIPSAVSFNSQTSQNIDMDSSILQGSTLGPLMYISYASELQVVAERHGVVFHSFADDTQLSKNQIPLR